MSTGSIEQYECFYFNVSFCSGKRLNLDCRMKGSEEEAARGGGKDETAEIGVKNKGVRRDLKERKKTKSVCDGFRQLH